MSWLFIVLLIFAAVSMIQGYRKGLLQTAISMVFLALVLVLTVWLNPYISDYIRNNTSLGQTVQEQCGKMLEEQFGDDGTAEDAEGQEAFIENLPLPQSLKDSLAQNNTAEMYQKLAVDDDSIFNRILTITQLVKKYELSPDRIEFSDDLSLTLYFDQVRVALGNSGSLEEKVGRLYDLFPDLEGRSGVFHMENYTDDSKFISFEQD